MAKLINVTVEKCLDCPFAVKGMAGMGCRNKDKKGIVTALIKDLFSIPSFCPLPDAPAGKAAKPKAEEPAPAPVEEPKGDEPKPEKKKDSKKGKKK